MSSAVIRGDAVAKKRQLKQLIKEYAETQRALETAGAQAPDDAAVIRLEADLAEVKLNEFINHLFS